jgi:hypothetical protein
MQFTDINQFFILSVNIHELLWYRINNAGQVIYDYLKLGKRNHIIIPANVR